MLQTPLIELHRAAGARCVDFAGWEMPLSYGSILDEHHWTRQHAAIFDVSHMGRVEFRGPDALPLLERLNTRNIGAMAVNQSRYSHMCRHDGGILDDVIVTRLEDHYLVVCNASNREKLLVWWNEQRGGANVEIIDHTFETAMVAIQGPEAIPTLDTLIAPLNVTLGDLKRYHARSMRYFGNSAIAARSGYTGEDGVEVILPAKFAMMALRELLERSAALGKPMKLAGLGARDTLRLEAGMPLYGHELTEDWDSITAGLAWCVDLSKDFIGRDVLARVKEQGPARRVVGLELEGRRVARQGATLLLGDTQVGVVTSGSHSPTFDRPLALAMVAPAHAEPGTMLEIDLRGTRAAAVVKPLPFYKRA